jgi:molybdenum cofactor cytidylyltransferase
MSEPWNDNRFAIVPAAGLSQRMGQPKLMLPLGSGTVIERVVTELKRASFLPVVVVRPDQHDLQRLVRDTGAMDLELPSRTTHMRETVEFALTVLSTKYHCRPEIPWLLVPADHPLLDATIIQRLEAALGCRPDCSLAVPVYQGRRGHPLMLRWKHYQGIRSFDKNQGINAYLRQLPHETLEVVVDTPDILVDLDTPDDYARIRRKWG